MLGRLGPLQERILRVLASVTPRWTLSGGGALAGVHTLHRATRDLDLFWQQLRAFDREPENVRQQLESAGLEVDVRQRTLGFCRFVVTDAADSTIVDLVADPVALAEPPMEITLGEDRILVDTPHQILVNKLCALLGRSELRDIQDVEVLLSTGGNLRRAIEDAARQDGGFSPLTLAYSLGQLPLAKLAAVLGWGDAAISALQTFRDGLVDRVLATALADGQGGDD